MYYNHYAIEFAFKKATILDTMADSKSITRTVTDAVVKWQNGILIEDVKGENIRLKFKLKNAKLYSFSFLP